MTPTHCGNGHELTPATWCLMSAAPAGAADNAGLSAPLRGAGGVG